MNSDQEALSYPIGGVGNPSPGNICQRPQDLIGYIRAALAQLTGQGGYLDGGSHKLLLPVPVSTIITSLCFSIPISFCAGSFNLHPTIYCQLIVLWLSFELLLLLPPFHLEISDAFLTSLCKSRDEGQR